VSHSEPRAVPPPPTCGCLAIASTSFTGEVAARVHTPQLAMRSVTVLTVSVLAVGLAAGTALPSAAGARTRSAGPAASFTVGGGLSGVAAISAASAWAVGHTGATRFRTLIVHGTGGTWKRVPSPSPALGASLSGVAVVSARSAWAVGESYTKTSARTLIEHWNGQVWKRVPSPSPDAFAGSIDSLSSVSVTSSGSAWAVGDRSCGCGPGPSLILRWNGTAWKQVPSPGDTALSSVAAVSARSAWAVGVAMSGDTSFKAVVLHWNGAAWKQVPSPSPRPSAELAGVAAASARSAWAVGYTFNSTGSKPPPKALILRWNGTTWT
jgi:hypothetical protein